MWGLGRSRLVLCYLSTPSQTTYVHILSAGLTAGPHGNILSTFLISSRESFEVTVSGGSTFARVKLKEIDGMAPQDVERAV